MQRVTYITEQRKPLSLLRKNRSFLNYTLDCFTRLSLENHALIIVSLPMSIHSLPFILIRVAGGLFQVTQVNCCVLKRGIRKLCVASPLRMSAVSLCSWELKIIITIGASFVLHGANFLFFFFNFKNLTQLQKVVRSLQRLLNKRHLLGKMGTSRFPRISEELNCLTCFSVFKTKWEGGEKGETTSLK